MIVVMDDAPKSAVELAMERLRKKDAEQGVSDRSLSDEQRAEIASIRQNYAAKLAQEDILFKSRLAATLEYEARLKLEDGHRREMQRLNDERDRKIEKVRTQ
jgi:exonuclease I